MRAPVGYVLSATFKKMRVRIDVLAVQKVPPLKQLEQAMYHIASHKRKVNHVLFSSMARTPS